MLRRQVKNRKKAADWAGGSHDIEDQEVFSLMDKKDIPAGDEIKRRKCSCGLGVFSFFSPKILRKSRFFSVHLVLYH